MATRQDLANAIRALSMDAVQKASSGHPGAPMGMAEIGRFYGITISVITQIILIGPIAIVLYYLMAMDQC